MGSAGDSPAPVGDPPTGIAESTDVKRPSPLVQTVASVPSGESPDGTGESPVPPKIALSKNLRASVRAVPLRLVGWREFGGHAGFSAGVVAGVYVRDTKLDDRRNVPAGKPVLPITRICIRGQGPVTHFAKCVTRRNSPSRAVAEAISGFAGFSATTKKYSRSIISCSPPKTFNVRSADSDLI